jgi:hypothetical protein
MYMGQALITLESKLTAPEEVEKGEWWSREGTGEGRVTLTGFTAAALATVKRPHRHATRTRLTTRKSVV